jgi:hypothetical protein
VEDASHCSGLSRPAFSTGKRRTVLLISVVGRLYMAE